MNKGLVIGIVVVAVIVIGGSLAISLKNAPDSGQAVEPAVEEASAGPGERAAPAPTPATKPIAAPASTPEPEPAAAPGTGPDLNAETIVGTEWQYLVYKFKFEADGKLVVNGVIPGTWAIEGDTLTVSAAGQTFKAKLKGDQLLIDDKPATRIEQEASSVADESASSQSEENEEGGG